MLRSLFFCFGLALLVMAAALPVFSQAQPVVVQVRDQHTGQSVPYANLCFQALDQDRKSFTVSDAAGLAEHRVEGPSLLVVSFMGYQTLTDTIFPGQRVELLLQPAYHNVSEVVVTGQFTPRQSDLSIHKVAVIGQQQIRMAAAPNLNALLMNQLGVQISQDNVLGSSLSLQGVSGQNVKILVDGVPLVGRLDGNLDLSQINMNNVERVELVEGPMSVDYGTNALAGVVNIITKDHVENQVESRLNAYHESVGVYNLDGMVGLNVAGNHVSLSGGRNFFDGFSPVDTSRWQQWKPKEQLFLDLRVRRKLGSTLLKYSGSAFDETVIDKGRPGRSLDAEGGRYIFQAIDAHYLTRRLNNNLNWEGIVGQNYYFNLILGHAHYQRFKYSYANNLSDLQQVLTANPTDHDTTLFRAWTARGTLSRYQHDDAPLNFKLGFDLNHETGYGPRIEDGSQRIGDYALFASLKLNLPFGLEVNPALRAAHNSQYAAPLTPSLNLMQKLGERLVLRASYARGFRAPSLKELYLDFVDLNHDIHGNTELLAERSHNFNASAVFSHGPGQTLDLKLEPSFFHNHITDKIDLLLGEEVRGVDTFLIYSYANFDEFRSLGARLQATLTAHPYGSLQLGYARVGTRSPWTSPDSFEFFSELNALAQLNWHRPGLAFQLNYKYTGPFVGVRLDAEGQPYTLREQDFHSLDFTLRKSLFDRQLDLSLGGKNLFGLTNLASSAQSGGVHSAGSSRPFRWGRTWFVSLAWNFSR